MIFIKMNNDIRDVDTNIIVIKKLKSEKLIRGYMEKIIKII